jgi:hypothetical protein
LTSRRQYPVRPATRPCEPSPASTSHRLPFELLRIVLHPVRGGSVQARIH